MADRFRPQIIRSRDVPLDEIATPFHPVGVGADRRKTEADSFNAGIDSAWKYCIDVWSREPHVWAWGWLIKTPRRPAVPYAATLHERFALDFPNEIHLIREKTLDLDPIIVGNALLCLHERPHLIPQHLFSRSEEVILRDWHFEEVVTIGDWARMVGDRAGAG
jgi:hypothetical protein